MIIIFDDKACDDRVLVTVSSQPHLALDQRDNQQRRGRVGIGVGVWVGGP